MVLFCSNNNTIWLAHCKMQTVTLCNHNCGFCLHASTLSTPGPIPTLLPLRWRHVRSEDNPADCASRGLLPSQLMVHDLWWDGPPWVSLDHGEWPQQDSSNGEPITEEHVYKQSKKITRVCEELLKLQPTCQSTELHGSSGLYPTAKLESQAHISQ